MKKWGIPEHHKAPEIALLERLVWVRYQFHWWPALIYHSYAELQNHLYDQLDIALKAQFSIAIMRQIQENRPIKVARLLGRDVLEVVEVEQDSYCEFYWQLPHVLPKACKRSRYGENLQLYYDFHRALDQVEEIIQEVSQEKFALMPDGEHMSWLERAHAAFQDDRSSIASNSRHSRASVSRPPRNYASQIARQEKFPDIPNHRSKESRKSSVESNDIGLWDNMMSKMSNSFETRFSAAIPEIEEDKPLEPMATRLPPSIVQNKRTSVTSSVSSRSHSSRRQNSSSLVGKSRHTSYLKTGLQIAFGEEKSGITEQMHNLSRGPAEYETRDPPSESTAQARPPPDKAKAKVLNQHHEADNQDAPKTVRNRLKEDEWERAVRTEVEEHALLDTSEPKLSFWQQMTCAAIS